MLKNLDLKLNSIPSWLEVPVTSTVKLPSVTRHQTLPFGELTWENFERLCLRLAKLENESVYCQLYGNRGQDQEGIDLFAYSKHNNLYCVYQCKRENNFNSGKIESAVNKFLEGKWVQNSSTFVLCTKESLVEKSRADELVKQRARLKDKQIELKVWDSEELSNKLKNLPELVDDFFGREWVKALCGEETANSLGERLDAHKIIEFRKQLGSFYNKVFTTHDPGLPILKPIREITNLPLKKRFVLPDIDNQYLVFQKDTQEEQDFHNNFITDDTYEDTFRKRSRRHIQKTRPTIYEQRHNIENWLATNSRCIILGVPGSGKSSLLRFLITDSLSDEPKLQNLATNWGKYLPIWVPFAFWTKQIANIQSGEVSLKDTICSWLKSWDEEDLWEIVKLALDDKRLLLLVDGLDEYTDESVAKIAISRLQVFIEQRELPAIITSRPHGFHQLGLQMSEWTIGTLSSFSTEQQEQLARIWFSNWFSNIELPTKLTEEVLERSVNKKIESFRSDLNNSGDLQELAKVPLLLCLLIAHELLNVQLPQNRFKAYESLIQYLMTNHPQNRNMAASVHSSALEINNEELKTILARLAFKIHENFAEGIINEEVALKFVLEFLKSEEDGGFGFTIAQARKTAKETIYTGENTLGILVKKSHSEIGFFHRTIQEYLTASFISALDFNLQLKIIKEHCIDPQWHEVILGIFYLTNRAEDIKSFVDLIRNRDVNPIEKLWTNLLLCEVVFGDFKMNVGMAREFAQDFFNKIEIGTDFEHREQLLTKVLNGLHSTKVKELVREKLLQWFPDRIQWSKEDLIKEMSGWKLEPDVIECLWKNLFDEEVRNQRCAATALAKIGGKDEELGNRLAQLAWNEIDVNIRAIAIECLVEGWIQHKDLPRIIQSNHKSLSPLLRLVAINARVCRGIITKKDLKELFFLSTHEAGLDYHWKDKVSEVIIRGWSGSLEVKQKCLEIVSSKYKSGYENGIAENILLKAFPQDDDVANHFAQHLTGPYFNAHSLLGYSLERSFFNTLGENFKDHPVIVAATDEFIQKNGFRDLESYDAALISRSKIGRDILLSELNNNISYFAVSTLLEGWGMSDPEVSGKISELINDNKKASRLSRLLPQIINNKEKCREFLLNLLNDSEITWIEEIIKALAELDKNFIDEKIVNLVLDKYKGEDKIYKSGIRVLIELGIPDEKVKEAAHKIYNDPSGDLHYIAKGLGNDPKLRTKLIEAVTPLSSNLRFIIASKLGEISDSDEFASQLLATYKLEQDKDVSTQAAISYYKGINSSIKDLNPLLEKLVNDTTSRNLDLGKIRYGAFCGLVILRRLELLPLTFPDKENSNYIENTIRIPIGEFPHGSPIPIHKLLLENWEYIKDIFGSTFYQRLISYSGNGDFDFWKTLCPFLDDYPLPRKEAIEYFEQNLEIIEPSSIEILMFLRRVVPKSDLLLNYCMKIINYYGQNQWRPNDLVFYVVEILAKQFGNNSKAFEQVRNLRTKVDNPKTDNSISENYILALTEGWSKSIEFDEMLEELKNSRQNITFEVFFHLASRKYSAEKLLEELIRFLSLKENENKSRCKLIIRPLIRRIRADDEFYEILKEQLQKGATPTQKSTFSRLITIARGINDIRFWCIEELTNQLSGKISPEVGFDLFYGSSLPVAKTLIDLMTLKVN